MKIKDVVEALERFAPLPLQESYDNAGLQIGLTGAEASGVLVCLDVTEAVVREAVERGCNLIVSHHPLLFRPVKHLTDATMVERVACEAIRHRVAIYAAHTNLDNAEGGVNHMIAARLGLQGADFLLPAASVGGVRGGSGLIGRLPSPEEPLAFLERVARTFKAGCLMHNRGPERPVQTVALCGGAGEFLLEEALRQGADVFLTGEMKYHFYFGLERNLWVGVFGHYESERFTVELLARILRDACPGLAVTETQEDTNPVSYMTGMDGQGIKS